MKRLVLMLGLFWLCGYARAENPPMVLTLKDAQAIVLQNHPNIDVAKISALIAEEETRQIRSAFFPMVSANVSAVEASKGARVAAGGLNNPSILSREANGLVWNQLLTDFGRTAELTTSSELRAQAEKNHAAATQADILFEVTRAYHRALQAVAVLRVAEQTVTTRQSFRDRIAALAKSQIKSQLDVHFANVNLAQAKLLQLRAQNNVDAAFAMLCTLLGFKQEQTFQLQDEPMPPPPPGDFAKLADQAVKQRPELAMLHALREATMKFADAEKALRYPTISAVGVAGITPIRDTKQDTHWRETYAAGGINVSVPVFDGGLDAARIRQAEYKVRVADQKLRETENEVLRDVRIAWLDAKTGLEALHVTSQLMTHAMEALQLAEVRYRMGTSSIVEYNQAELNETEAEISVASARYDYLIQTARLEYELGSVSK